MSETRYGPNPNRATEMAMKMAEKETPMTDCENCVKHQSELTKLKSIVFGTIHALHPVVDGRCDCTVSPCPICAVKDLCAPPAPVDPIQTLRDIKKKLSIGFTVGELCDMVDSALSARRMG